MSAVVERLASSGDIDSSLTVAVPARELVDLIGRLQSQPIIEQAKGIVMSHYRIDADTAFLVLRRWSQDGNVKLRVLAQAVVEESTRKSPVFQAPHEVIQAVVHTPAQSVE